MADCGATAGLRWYAVDILLHATRDGDERGERRAANGDNPGSRAQINGRSLYGHHPSFTPCASLPTTPSTP